MTIMIQLGGAVVASVGATRAYLAPHVEALPADDPHRVLVLGMCDYALSLAGSGRAYDDEDAIRAAVRQQNA